MIKTPVKTAVLLDTANDEIGVIVETEKAIVHFISSMYNNAVIRTSV